MCTAGAATPHQQSLRRYAFQCLRLAAQAGRTRTFGATLYRAPCTMQVLLQRAALQHKLIVTQFICHVSAGHQLCPHC